MPGIRPLIHAAAAKGSATPADGLRKPAVFALLLTVITLSACQSTPSQAFRFATRITDDGYKLFQLSYPLSTNAIRLPGSGDNRRRDRQVNEQQVLGELEARLSRNGYCRQGYVLLGRYAGQTSNRIRGECRDKATPADRQAFPDTIEQW